MKLTRSQLSDDVAQLHRTENNALVRTAKDASSDRIEVEIGDTKSEDFFPQAKIKRWDNEVNFSLRWKTDDPATPELSTDRDKIVYRKGKQAFRAYHLEPGEVGEDGGLEIDIVLDEKPETNVFEFTLQTKELDFFYQPALTPEEIADGAERPENVVGSYAVYHKSKANNRVGGKAYRTGKAFHIYRPKVTDAKGNETWAELAIDEQAGVLSVTVPQNFLDEAVYPVIVDPTFGYTSVGASGDYRDTNQYYATKFTAPEDGLVDSVSVYNGYTDNRNMKGLVIDSSLDIVPNGIGNPVATGTTASWETSPYSNKPSITGSSDYWLTGIVSSGFFQYRYDSGSPNQSFFLSSGGGNYSNPTNPSGGTVFYSNDKFSIYATYTAGGGATNVEATPSAQSATTSQPSPSVTAERNVEVAPTAQAVVVSLPTPSILTVTDVEITPTVQATTASLPPPSVTTVRAVEVTPTAQALTTVQPDPTISTTKNVEVTPDALTATLALPAPTVQAIRNVEITPDSLSLTTVANGATVTEGFGVEVTPSTQAVSATTPDPSISTTRNIITAPNAQTLTLSASDVTVQTVRNVEVSPDAQALTTSQATPAISAGGNINISVGVQSLSATQGVPAVSTGANVSPSAQSASVTANSPTVQTARNVTVSPNAQTVTASAPDAVVSTMSVATQELNVTAPQPTVTAVRNVTVTPDPITLIATIATPRLVIWNPGWTDESSTQGIWTSESAVQGVWTDVPGSSTTWD